jgi:hypothetical protein
MAIDQTYFAMFGENLEDMPLLAKTYPNGSRQLIKFLILLARMEYCFCGLHSDKGWYDLYNAVFAKERSLLALHGKDLDQDLYGSKTPSNILDVKNITGLAFTALVNVHIGVLDGRRRILRDYKACRSQSKGTGLLLCSGHILSSHEHYARQSNAFLKRYARTRQGLRTKAETSSLKDYMLSVLLSNLRGDGIFEPFPVDGEEHDSANEEMADVESEDESDAESDKDSNKKPIKWNVLKKKLVALHHNAYQAMKEASKYNEHLDSLFNRTVAEWDLESRSHKETIMPLEKGNFDRAKGPINLYYLTTIGTGLAAFDPTHRSLCAHSLMGVMQLNGRGSFYSNARAADYNPPKLLPDGQVNPHLCSEEHSMKTYRQAWHPIFQVRELLVTWATQIMKEHVSKEIFPRVFVMRRNLLTFPTLELFRKYGNQVPLFSSSSSGDYPDIVKVLGRGELKVVVKFLLDVIPTIDSNNSFPFVSLHQGSRKWICGTKAPTPFTDVPIFCFDVAGVQTSLLKVVQKIFVEADSSYQPILNALATKAKSILSAGNLKKEIMHLKREAKKRETKNKIILELDQESVSTAESSPEAVPEETRHNGSTTALSHYVDGSAVESGKLDEDEDEDEADEDELGHEDINLACVEAATDLRTRKKISKLVEKHHHLEAINELLDIISNLNDTINAQEESTGDQSQSSIRSEKTTVCPSQSPDQPLEDTDDETNPPVAKTVGSITKKRQRRGPQETPGGEDKHTTCRSAKHTRITSRRQEENGQHQATPARTPNNKSNFGSAMRGAALFTPSSQKTPRAKPTVIFTPSAVKAVPQLPNSNSRYDDGAFE